MMAAVAVPDLRLPWESTLTEDRWFHKLLAVALVIFGLSGLVIPWLPAVEQKLPVQTTEPAQLAKVILEPKDIPEPKVLTPKPKPKPRKKPPVKAPEKKPVEVAKTEPPKPDLDQAKTQAARSGVLAFQDELLELRDQLDPSTLNQTAAAVSEGKAAQVDRALVGRASAKASGGITTAAVSLDAGGVALSARENTRVENSMADLAADQQAQSRSAQLGGRSDESIRRVMDRNKGAVFSIYNRALRHDPRLTGKVMFEMLIDANGRVEHIKLLSSTLQNEGLTTKILARIRMIDFGAEPVLTTKVNYSFDFLPYS